MNGGMISKRYAKALLQYAVEQKSEDKVFAEMKMISSVFANEPKLRMAMGNPMVTAADKLKLMEAAVGGNATSELVRFVELVVKNKRESHFQVIALGYQDLYCVTKQINRGRLVTATPVGNTVLEKMRVLLQKVKPGTLELETSVDPSIAGGFVLYVDTYRFDASIASQLKQIKKKFVAESTKIV